MTVIVWIWFWCSVSLTAETSAPASDSIRVKYHLNPVVVTASKIPVAQRSLAASISVIDETMITGASSTAVLDAVQAQVPGLYVTEWGVMGFGAAGSAAGKLSMRGVGGGSNSCVLILRNGRPDFMGLMGCTMADEFSTDGVERIEVQRGPGSFLYGTNAIGGIINLIPRKIKTDGFDTRFSTGGGSFGSKFFSVSHGGKIGRFDYYLTGATRRTNGHRSDADAGYRGDHYTIHAGYEIKPGTELEFNGNLADVRVYDPGPLSSPSFVSRYDIFRYGGDLDLVSKNRLGETNVKLHANFGWHEFFDGWKSIDRTTGFMVYHNASPWAGNTATVGFDWKEYGGDAKDASADYSPRYITEYAPYVHVQQVLFRQWILSAGIRVENHELYGREVLPKAGLVYQPFERTSIRVSAAKGFRSPSIRELYFWAPANVQLTPDRLNNVEVGLSQGIGRNMNVEADVFKSEGSNLIQLVAPPPKWANSGKYTHMGYEILWTWLPSPGFETGATWSKMDLSKFAFNAPGKKLTAHVKVKLGAVGLSANLLMVNDWKGVESKGSKNILHDMPDHTVVNASASVGPFHGIGLRLHVRNLFDKSYQAMYGYPMPGLNWMIEMDYSF